MIPRVMGDVSVSGEGNGNDTPFLIILPCNFHIWIYMSRFPSRNVDFHVFCLAAPWRPLRMWAQGRAGD